MRLRQEVVEEFLLNKAIEKAKKRIKKQNNNFNIKLTILMKKIKNTVIQKIVNNNTYHMMEILSHNNSRRRLS